MNKTIQEIALKYKEELATKLESDKEYNFNKDAIYYLLIKLEKADYLVKKYWAHFDDADLVAYRDLYKD